MICPYCNKEMMLGRIPQDRFTIKWIPEEKCEGIKMIKPFKKGLRLNPKLHYIKAYRCENCKKLIIDQDENESYMETDDSVWYF